MKIIGFYDSCFFSTKEVNDNSGYITLNEETGEEEYISHSQIRKSKRNLSNEPITNNRK